MDFGILDDQNKKNNIKNHNSQQERKKYQAASLKISDLLLAAGITMMQKATK